MCRWNRSLQARSVPGDDADDWQSFAISRVLLWRQCRPAEILALVLKTLSPTSGTEKAKKSRKGKKREMNGFKSPRVDVEFLAVLSEYRSLSERILGHRVEQQIGEIGVKNNPGGDGNGNRHNR